MNFKNKIPKENYGLWILLKWVNYPQNLARSPTYSFRLSNLNDAEDEEILLNFFRIINFKLPTSEKYRETDERTKELTQKIKRNISKEDNLCYILTENNGYITIYNEISSILDLISALEEFITRDPIGNTLNSNNINRNSKEIRFFTI